MIKTLWPLIVVKSKGHSPSGIWNIESPVHGPLSTGPDNSIKTLYWIAHKQTDKHRLSHNILGGGNNYDFVSFVGIKVNKAKTSNLYYILHVLFSILHQMSKSEYLWLWFQMIKITQLNTLFGQNDRFKVHK